jgi:hypothetical protein
MSMVTHGGDRPTSLLSVYPPVDQHVLIRGKILLSVNLRTLISIRLTVLSVNPLSV